MPFELAGMGGQIDVLPRAPWRDMLIVRPNAVPGCGPEIAMSGFVLGALQDARSNVGFREVGNRVAARFKQQNHMLAVGDPAPSEANAQAPTQPLGEQ